MNEQLHEGAGQDALLEAALNGDETAFRQLYQEMYGTLGAIVFNMLDKRTMAKEGASDLVQDAFVKVWEKRDQLATRNLAGFQAWLIEIVRNLARDKYAFWRREIRNVSREQPIAPDSGPGMPLQAPDPTTGRQRRIDLVWKALNDLPLEQREAIRLQKFENWTQAQIAQRLNCSESKVQGLLRRGKRALARDLKGSSQDGTTEQ